MASSNIVFKCIGTMDAISFSGSMMAHLHQRHQNRQKMKGSIASCGWFERLLPRRLVPWKKLKYCFNVDLVVD